MKRIMALLIALVLSCSFLVSCASYDRMKQQQADRKLAQESVEDLSDSMLCNLAMNPLTLEYGGSPLLDHDMMEEPNRWLMREF